MELALSAPMIISSGLAILSLVLGSLLILFPTIVCIRDSYRIRRRTLVLPGKEFSASYATLPQQEKFPTNPDGNNL
jgi:hypothetical protein